MSLTEMDVLTDIAKSLDVELPKKATLGELRLVILAAIDRLENRQECLQKTATDNKRRWKHYRAKAKAAFRYDLQNNKICA